MVQHFTSLIQRLLRIFLDRRTELPDCVLVWQCGCFDPRFSKSQPGTKTFYPNIIFFIAFIFKGYYFSINNILKLIPFL